MKKRKKLKPKVLPSEAWDLARKILQIAYSYEKNYTNDSKSKEIADLYPTFVALRKILENYEKKLSTEFSKLILVGNLSRVTKIFKGITEGTISSKEAREKLLLILSTEDDDHVSLKAFVPFSKAQITGHGGPSDAAAVFLSDHFDYGTRAPYTYQEKAKQNKINTSFLAVELDILRNHEEFVKLVTKRLLVKKLGIVID